MALIESVLSDDPTPMALFPSAQLPAKPHSLGCAFSNKS